MRLLEKENMQQNKNNLWLSRGLQALGAVAFFIIVIAVFQSFTSEKESKQTEDETTIEEQIEVQKIYAPSLPEKPEFCGEKVDLSDPEVMERFDREMVVNSFLHGSTILMLKKANRYFPQIEKILKEEKVPDDMKYLCVAESGLAHVVSPAGATGFWQFMKTTGLSYGLYIDDDIDERYNIEKATYAACKYLKESKQKFGTWSMAAAAYNAGDNGMLRQVNLQGQDSYFDLHLNQETSRYIFRILALKYILNDPENYGFNIKPKELYPPFELKKVTVSESNVDWVSFASEHKITYKTLKYYNPQIRKATWANRNKTKIEILLPVN